MKKYETKPIMREEKTLKEVICDTCKKEVEDEGYQGFA